MTTIYVKDGEEKQNLQSKYPDVDATWKFIPSNMLEKLKKTPLVCNNNEQPLESCPAGEDYIKKLPKVE